MKRPLSPLLSLASKLLSARSCSGSPSLSSGDKLSLVKTELSVLAIPKALEPQLSNLGVRGKIFLSGNEKPTADLGRRIGRRKLRLISLVDTMVSGKA